jgi:hypothetical protein
MKKSRRGEKSVNVLMEQEVHWPSDADTRTLVLSSHILQLLQSKYTTTVYRTELLPDITQLLQHCDHKYYYMMKKST